MRKVKNKKYNRRFIKRDEILHEIGGILIGMFFAICVFAVITVVGVLTINNKNNKEQQGVLLSEMTESEEGDFSSENQSTYPVQEEEKQEETDKEQNKEQQEEQQRQMQEIAKACENSYHAAEKGKAINVTLSESNQREMAKELATTGYAIATTGYDSNLCNYETIRDNMELAINGDDSNFKIFLLDSSGGVHGNFYYISGDKMRIHKWYLSWDENEEPVLDNQGELEAVSWKYTSKGWLIYEEQISENPEMDYHVMIRVLPLKDEYREYCRKYVEPLCEEELNISLMMPGYPPIPEVVDAVKNEDGSLTMQVDGLKQDKGTDLAYSGKVTVMDRGSEGVEYIQDEISKEYEKR